MYENCKGALGIADDVQIFGNEKTHDRNLPEAIECTRKAGIKLNFDKCVKTKCCSFFFFFFGNLSTPERFKPDPKKVDAATNEQTAAQFFLRYGNLSVSIYAKHFFFDIRFEGFA